MPSSSSNSISITNVSTHSPHLDNRSSSSSRGASCLKSDSSAEEPVGSHVESVGPPSFESSAGAGKDTVTLKVENTNPDTEAAKNVNSLEESAALNSRRVRKTKKKPRKPVKVYSEPFMIPPGHVWLAGDNTANSTDSRYQLVQSILISSCRAVTCVPTRKSS
jgi:Signal peptidase, peptidase S26